MIASDAIGYLASALVLAAFCMREMIPLRAVAVCSNIAFLIYGLALGLVPVWLLHAVLMPINCWRLWEGISQSLHHGTTLARHSSASGPERMARATVWNPATVSPKKNRAGFDEGPGIAK
jgi:hypothetical protein